MRQLLTMILTLALLSGISGCTTHGFGRFLSGTGQQAKETGEVLMQEPNRTMSVTEIILWSTGILTAGGFAGRKFLKPKPQ